MAILRRFCVLVVFLVPVLAPAQSEDEKLREKQLRQARVTQQVIADIPNFKLGGNRAYIYAKAGSLIWKTDQKLAGDLFRRAVTELINAQSVAEGARKSTPNNELLTGQGPRHQILNAIAIYDAEFALDSLYRTRPAAVERAISSRAYAQNKSGSSYGYNNFHLAQNELNLEQQFLRRAAEQNPNRAAGLLKESLKKGLSNETIEALKKLHSIDPGVAKELADEVVAKLVGKNFIAGNQPDHNLIQLSTMILSDFIRERQPNEKALKFDDLSIKSLADKLIAFHLETAPRYGNYYFQSIIPIAEKLAPGTVKRLKSLERSNPHRGWGNDPDVQKLMQENPTADKLIAEAKRFPVENRSQIYQTAANKMSDAGDYAGALALLNDNFSDEALENAVNSLNWYYAHHLMNQQKFSEAERLIDEFPDNNRIVALIQLANTVFNKNNIENKAYALSLLGKARSQLSDTLGNSNELTQYSQLITAYGGIEPTEAFRMSEPLMPQLNELCEASIIVQAFQGAQNIQQGEMLIVNGAHFGFYLDVNVFQKLAEIDFERTINLIETFSRREMRVYLKLVLAESIAN